MEAENFQNNETTSKQTNDNDVKKSTVNCENESTKKDEIIIEDIGEENNPSTSTNNGDMKETLNNQRDSDNSITTIKRKSLEDEEEEQLSMDAYLDLIKEEIYLDEQTTGLLGGADENTCTYELPENYVKRQPLYSCVTCKMNTDPISGEKYMAGICFACSEHCHKDHILVELYTKRNFCCDCGNDKFAENKCKLFKKIGMNEKNQYNHNFNGLYCTCEMPYPSEDFVDDMLQCCICEDWFHQTHLDAPSRKGYADMICTKCVQTNDFLVYYHEAGCFDFEEFDEPEDATDDKRFNSFCNDLDQIIAKNNQEQSNLPCKLIELKQKFQEKFFPETKPEEADVKKRAKSYYLAQDWRLKLCKCCECLKMYDQMNVSFITDPRDMVVVYTHWNLMKETEKRSSKMNRTQEIILEQGLKTFKEELVSFLGKYKDQSLITAKDVEDFVTQLKNKKPKKIGIQYFCG